MDSSNDALSRRHAVGVLSLGVAGMAAGSAMADPPQSQSRATSTQSRNPDPRTKYPAPRFRSRRWLAK